MLLLLLSLASFLLSFCTIALIKQRFSQQFLDIPNERSSHTQPTPRGGGVGFIIAFVLTSTIASTLGILASPILVWWLILLPVTLIGILDDYQSIAAAIRYLVQLLSASIAVVYFGAFPLPGLNDLGSLDDGIAIAFTLIATTALINFYNFMDGLDGLVAGCTAVELSFFAFYLNQPLLWLLVAALLSFLCWNWSPAKIFMGDAGSTVLGTTVAITLLDSSDDPIRTWSALAITFPLVSDAIYTLVRRLIQQENIFKAHRSHLYQRLQQSGLSHRQIATFYISINCLIAGCIILLGTTGAWLSLFIVITAIILGEIYLISY